MTRRLLAIGVLVLGSCAGGADSVPLGIDTIAAAVEAVRAEIDGEPRFYEINSTETGVNLFLQVPQDSGESVPGVVQARYTADEGLVLSDEVLEASGSTFAFPDLDLSSDRLTSTVLAELPESTPRMFVMTAAGDGSSSTDGVSLRVIMESEMGGRLSVFVDFDGRILGTDVLG